VNKEAADATKIYGSKEVDNVKVENEKFATMNVSIGYNGSPFMKTMGGEPEMSIFTFSLLNTGVKCSSGLSVT